MSTQLSEKEDHELFAQARDPFAEDEKSCLLAEAELGDRILHRCADTVHFYAADNHLEDHWSIRDFLDVLTATTHKDRAARRRAAEKIPSFQLLRQCFYAAIVGLEFALTLPRDPEIAKSREHEIAIYAVAILRHELNVVFRGIHGWEY